GIETNEEITITDVQKVPLLSYRRKLDQSLKKLIAGEDDYEEEFKIKQKGTGLIRDIYSVAVYDSIDQKVIGTIKDVSGIKQTERQLKAIEQRFRMAIEGTNDGLWDLDLTNQSAYISERYAAMLGYQKTELPETIDAWVGLLHPDDVDDAKAALERYLNKETHVYNAVFRMRTKIGSYKWINGRGRAIWDEHGKPIRIIGFNTDITEQKNAQINLEKSQQRYIKIISELMLGIVIHVDHKIEYVNKAMLQLAGYTDEQEVLGKNILDFVHPEDRQAVLNTISDKMNSAEGGSILIEERIIRKDGQIIITEASAIRTSFDNKEALMVVIHDITKRKEAEWHIKQKNEEYLAANEELKESLQHIKIINAQLEEAKEKAEESERLKTAFLANMSHEIRTPMNSIIGFSQMLRKPNLAIQKQQRYIDIITKSGHRMLGTINDIVDISKIEAGQAKVYVTEFNINEQLEYLYAAFKPEANAKGLSLKYENVRCKKPQLMVTDKDKTDAILINIIKNAIKYTDKGFVSFGYTAEDDQLQFYVEDSGIGIPRNRQKAIFDRFVQADIEDKEVREGTGLGLSITKAYIDMLGGHIELTSEPGEGSIFRFTLPRRYSKS
ncbi:MAG: PAS domain-containing protein, partial [Salinivirgaceae bacterium]